MKNTDFKVGAIIKCIGEKYEVIRNTPDIGITVKHVQYGHEFGPYNNNSLVEFKLDPGTKQFFPEPGDTIVCENGNKYICCARENYTSRDIYPDYKIYTEIQGSCDHMCWKNHDGVAKLDNDFNIKEIIPAKKTNTVTLKVDVQNVPEVQFTLRALELENQFLRTLLRKQGVDI